MTAIAFQAARGLSTFGGHRSEGNKTIKHTSHAEYNTFLEQTTLKKIVGAGQYSSVRCLSLHVYNQNVEASASNHFAWPRKPAIGRKVNQKNRHCTEQISSAED